MEEDLFAPAKDAGLRQVELAKIAGVSRLTACNWMNGKGQPHALHRAKIVGLMDQVHECLQRGTLPVSPRLKGADRMEKIFAVLAEV